MGNAGSSRDYSGAKDNKRTKNAHKRRHTAPSSTSQGRNILSDGKEYFQHSSLIPPVAVEASTLGTITECEPTADSRNDNRIVNRSAAEKERQSPNPGICQPSPPSSEAKSSPLTTLKSDDDNEQASTERAASSHKPRVSESIDIQHSGHSAGTYGQGNSADSAGSDSVGKRKPVVSDNYSQSLSDNPSQCFAEHLQKTDRTMMSENSNPMLQTVLKWDRGGREVFLTGTFTDWKPIKMIQSQGDFFTVVDVPEGHHEYKFIVDGHEKTDPNSDLNDRHQANILEVKKSDFEVFEALENDIANEEKNKERRREPIGDLSGSPPGVYSQEVPTGFESHAHRSNKASSNPPVLPPYLLEVILNNPKSFHDKILLPQPNHVMLNHLYALSIQDGVMVMSDIHRYRNKYVTTLFYKPI